jgi:hypothetical protein
MRPCLLLPCQPRPAAGSTGMFLWRVAYQPSANQVLLQIPSSTWHTHVGNSKSAAGNDSSNSCKSTSDPQCNTPCSLEHRCHTMQHMLLPGLSTDGAAVSKEQGAGQDGRRGTTGLEPRARPCDGGARSLHPATLPHGRQPHPLCRYHFGPVASHVVHVSVCHQKNNVTQGLLVVTCLCAWCLPLLM